LASDIPLSASQTRGRRSLLRRGLALEAVTVAYNVVEAVVAIAAGVWAGSIALVGFGLDSVIEVTAAAVVGHRLWTEARGADLAAARRSEARALWVVGLTFFALSAYVVWEAAGKLISAEAPEPSLIGLIVAGLSLLLMPFLGWLKLRTGRALGSGALVADAKETFVCAYLSLALLAGIGLNAWLGWWWADPVAALAMVPLMIHEGREALEEAREHHHEKADAVKTGQG
jgi:divalent metal cation (Fe/Co/Zn/Cd) transporter